MLRTSAQRLLALGLASGDRVAIIADTTPEFVELFFACRYAGLIPFAMPVPVNLGSHAVYVQQLRGMLEGGQASAALANVDYISFSSKKLPRDRKDYAGSELPSSLESSPPWI